MGTWSDAYDRLREAKDSGASVSEVEELAGTELDQLLADD